MLLMRPLGAVWKSACSARVELLRLPVTTHPTKSRNDSYTNLIIVMLCFAQGCRCKGRGGRREPIQLTELQLDLMDFKGDATVFSKGTVFVSSGCHKVAQTGWMRQQFH